MKKILDCYINSKIGINLESPFKIEPATLITADANYFSITCEKDNYTHHFSYSSIVQIIENSDGVEIKHLFSQNETYSLIVKVGHLMEYIPT